MTQRNPVLIGIDGGGTGCRAALLFPDGRRTQVRGGSANVSDFDRALEAITAVLAELTLAAGLVPSDLATAALHLGLAGVTGPAMAARVRSALMGQMELGRITVSGDQTTTIAGALGAGDGAVAGIGTGSFVGRQSGGVIQSLGGHGFLLGDQASGAWLGKRLLEDLMLAGDGIGAHSALTREVVGDYGGDRAAIIAFAIAARPADFAAYAPRILDAAARGDALAERLMREGAAYIVASLTALGSGADEPICLTGGIGPHYRNWLPADLGARVRAPLGSALDGALALAERGGWQA